MFIATNYFHLLFYTCFLVDGNAMNLKSAFLVSNIFAKIEHAYFKLTRFDLKILLSNG